MRSSVATVLILHAISLVACAPETEVKLRFEPFNCGSTVADSGSLMVVLSELVWEPPVGAKLRRIVEHSRCIGKTSIHPLAGEVARVVREQGGLLAGVPADRDTQLVILYSLGPACAQPFPICLVSDPIRAGGEPQTAVVRGLCAPALGTMPQAWLPCASTIVALP